MSQHGCPERLSNRSKGFQEDGAGQATMEVLVETLTGTAFEMTVSPSDTVFAIKSKIFRVEGIPVSQQHLVYNLKELEDSASLLALGISDGARLRLVLGMRGGPISTRRLPPPSDLGSELERLLTTNHRYRESSSWSGSSGCKVTVLVFRDGERVNMLRVRENRDGTLQPLDHANSYAVERATATATTSAAEGAAGDNVVTMNKMLELRRRMEALSVRRHQPDNKPEIQKTRSEETLSVPSLLDADCPPYSPYGETDDACMPLYDGHYTRYYDSLFTDRYTLLPPIGSRTDSEQSVDHIPEEGELAGTLAGSILVQRDDTVEAAGDGPAPGAGDGAGAVVLGGGWRTRAFGSSSQLAPPSPSPSPSLAPPSPAPLAAAAHSASTLTLRAPPPLGALFSSSTSDLETLKRNILPLSRHRNREHLHLSDEGLDHTREIGSERRQRRIKKIAELESSRLFRFGDSYEDVAKETDKEEKKDKKIRIRCGFCKKRLSIATVHKCRCGAEFCAPHRYAEVHGCAYDYKANAHQFLTRANPLVSAPKLPKI